MESGKPALFATLWQDVRFGGRILRRSPGVTLVIVLALAAGIGANSAMFSVLDSLVLHRVRYQNPEELSVVLDQDAHGDLRGTSAGNFLDWRKAQSFSGMAAMAPNAYLMTGVDKPVHLRGVRVTANIFDVLGAQAMLGRTFVRGEDGLDGGPSTSRVAVISYALWRDAFGSDPNVLGRTVRLNDRPFDIVGVMHPEFELFYRRYQVWVPAVLDGSDHDYRYLVVVARRKVGGEDAGGEMRAISQRLAQAFPQSNNGWTAHVEPLEEWLVDAHVRMRLVMLFVAVGLVLLLACSNVASLLLTRAASRSRELALRVALGATRWRIIRQLLVESLTLSLAGGALGLVVAGALIRVAPAVIPASAIPGGAPFELSPLVIEVTLGVSLLTGLLFGMAPAVAASRPDVQEVLQDTARGTTGGRGRHVFRQAMVTLQVAVALALLSGAALMVRAMQRLYETDLGVKTEGVLTQRIFLPVASYNPDQSLRLHQQVLERVKALAGVKEAATGSEIPLSAPGMEVGFDRADGPLGEMNPAAYTTTTPGYFHLLGVPLIDGRDFTEADSGTAPGVAIVNQAFVQRFLGGRRGVGQRLRMVRPVLGTNSFGAPEVVEVVGVVGNVTLDKIGAPATPLLYAPMAQSVWSTTHWLVVRTVGDPELVASAIRKMILDVDPRDPLDASSSLEGSLATQFAEPKFQSELMGGFALLALGLALVGIYSVNAYAVSQRSREIGVRLALGAPPSWVLRDVLVGGLNLTLVGVALGLGVAVMLNKLLASALVDVGALEFLPLAAAVVLLVATAALACFVPAWRATRIDPAIALRSE